MSIKLKSETIKKIVYNKLRKDEEETITLEELELITNITLNRLDNQAKEINYDFADLKYLKNIESCTLNGFCINKEITNVLNNLENLKTLTLNHCIFENESIIDNNIENIIITYSNCRNFNIFKNLGNIKTLQLINIDKIDIKEIKAAKNIESLSIFNSKIKNSSEIKDFENLKELKIDGSLVDNPNFIDLLNKDVKFRYHKKYYLEA